jgi:hypothetical protein
MVDLQNNSILVVFMACIVANFNDKWLHVGDEKISIIFIANFVLYID